MANSSNQQNGTQNETSFQRYSSSECIAWLTVVMTESVAIVTFNILTIIVLRMMIILESDAGILRKKKSECSYQESNLRPFDY